MEGKNEIKQSRRMSEITAREDCGGSRNPPPLRKSRELIDASGVHLNQDTAANAEHYVPVHSELSTKEMSFLRDDLHCPRGRSEVSAQLHKVSLKTFKLENTGSNQVVQTHASTQGQREDMSWS